MTGAEQARALAERVRDDYARWQAGQYAATGLVARLPALLPALDALDAELREAREALVGLHTLEDQYEDAIQKLREAREALERIRDLPSEHDLLTNAMARAMYEIAVLARAGEQT